MKLYLREKKELKALQAGEQKALDLRLKIQTQAAEAKLKSLEKIDKREIAALMREMKSQQRVRERGESGIPKFTDVLVNLSGKPAPAKLSEQFDRADHGHFAVPDVMGAFSRAAGIEDESASRDDGREEIEKAERSDPETGPRPEGDRDKGRGL